jgi:NTE family protein
MMFLHARLLAAILLLLAAIPKISRAAEAPPTRPRIGLCLAGGGARGGAHIGVLRVLEELRIPIDCIAGTSIGSIIGGLYASGYSPQQLDSTLVGMDWSAVFNDSPPRHQIEYRRLEEQLWPRFGLEFGLGGGGLRTGSGVIIGQNLNFVLRERTLHTTGIDDFDDFPIPFRAVAADLADGRMVVLDHGSLADAMRASMAIPGAFTPHEIDGRLLIDGGIVRNLPYDIVKAMGADIVILVDVGTPVGELDPHPGFLSVAMRAMNLAAKANVAETFTQVQPHDLLLVPDLEGITTASFPQMAAAAERGEAAARANLEALRKLSVDENAYAEWQARQRAGHHTEKVRLADVVIDTDGRIDRRRVERAVRTSPGDTLDMDVVHQDLSHIYRLGEFEAVDFELRGRPDGTAPDLVIETHDKSWGPQYLSVGLALTDHFDGEAAYRFALYHRLAAINARGAEWRSQLILGETFAVHTEFYQPLTFSGRWFVAPRFLYSQDKKPLVIGEDSVFFTDEVRWRASFDFGVHPSISSEMRLGIHTGNVRTEVREFAEFLYTDDHEGAVHWSFGLDRFDRASFPKSGWFTQASMVASRSDLGADVTYDRAAFALRGATSAGHTTFITHVEAGSSFGSDLPISDDFELGGFGRLSGRAPGAKYGDDLALLVVGMYRQIARMSAPIGGAVFVGLTAEVGDTWDLDEDPVLDDLELSGAAFLGAETFLGPVYLGYGAAEQGYDQFFLYIGRHL